MNTENEGASENGLGLYVLNTKQSLSIKSFHQNKKMCITACINAKAVELTART